MPSDDSTRKMRLYRDRLRAQGLRPVQIWVPDSRTPGFKRSLQRQIANLDSSDETDALEFIEKVSEDPEVR